MWRIRKDWNGYTEWRIRKFRLKIASLDDFMVLIGVEFWVDMSQRHFGEPYGTTIKRQLASR